MNKTPTAAGGAKALFSAAKHLFAAMPIARGFKILRLLNQDKGIDCPGCAWPDPDSERKPLAEYCENGVKAIAEEATTRSLGTPFFQKYSIPELWEKSDFWLGKQGRLSHPMHKKEGSKFYEPITWENAFERIANHLKSLNNPNEAIFYTSGRSSNEAAWLFQLFARAFGTNNLPDCSNMCHESSGLALQNTLGIGKGTVTLEDFDKAEVILIFGQNPGTNHPRMLTALQKAKRNGAKVISINPLREVGLSAFNNPQEIQGLLGFSTSLSDHYLQLRINSDLALIKYILFQLFLLEKENQNVFDLDFIQAKTDGFASFKENISKENPELLLQSTGLQKSDVDPVISLLAKKKKIIACWAMGLTQHENAVATIQELVNLLLLKGSVGIPGAGTCPVRGHSNVQGDRTVGITHKPSSELNEALKHRFNFDPPSNHGYDVVEAIEAMHQKKAAVFLALGGNFYSAAPDSHFTKEALENCSLTVHISTKLNRSHLVCGKEALILPCLGRTDKDMPVSTENSMGVVQLSQGNLVPLSSTILSEPAILCQIAAKTLENRLSIPWGLYEENYDFIREDIAKTIAGFTAYNQKLQNKGGFYLPNAPRQGQFPTKTGKARFTVNLWEPKRPDHFVLMTLRSHDQFNTTIYGLDDRYRGIKAERNIVFMNPEDLRELNLKDGDKVDITNHTNEKQRKVMGFKAVAYSIPRGNIAMYFPEANPLVPISLRAKGSQTPASKSVPVVVEKNY